MRMTLFKPKIKQTDIALFLEQLSFLLSVGHTSYDAVHLIYEGATSNKRRDAESKKLQMLCEKIVPELREGYTLSVAMQHVGEEFSGFAKQVESAEAGGNVPEALEQIVERIREGNTLTSKMKTAMMYPMIVLVITVAVSWYLFKFIVPDMLKMLLSMGTGEVPPATQMVANIVEWLEMFGPTLFVIVILGVLVLLFLAKGPMKASFHWFYTKIPFVSKIIASTSVCIWMQSMKYMLSAGAPMADALSAAADSISNHYIQKKANAAFVVFASTGIAASKALAEFTFLTAIELSSLSIGLRANRAIEVLDRLYKQRKKEAEKSIDAFITALTPMIIVILGLVVGVIILAVYGPIFNTSSMVS